MNDEERDARVEQIARKVDQLHTAMLGSLDSPGGFLGQQTAFLSRLEAMERTAEACHKRIDQHEEDIGILKRWRVYVIGIATGIATVFRELFTSH